MLLIHRGVRWVTFGWVAFIAENLVLSHNREDIIAKLGDSNYHTIYNTLSTVACSSIAYGFFKYGKFGGPQFHRRSAVVHLSGMIIQAIGLIGISQLIPTLQVPIGILRETKKQSNKNHISGQSSSTNESEIKITVRCPMDFRPKTVSADGLFGMERVTRHPAIWSLGFIGLGSAISTGKEYIYIYISNSSFN